MDAASAVALRRTRAPASPRNWDVGGSHSASVSAALGAPSAVTAVAGRPVSSFAHSAGSLMVAEASMNTASRPVRATMTRRSRRSTCAMCEPNTPR